MKSIILADAERSGVAEVDESGGRVLCIEEKPEASKSDADILRAGYMDSEQVFIAFYSGVKYGDCNYSRHPA